MLVGRSLDFVAKYVGQLSIKAEQKQPKQGLTWGQKAWLEFTMMRIIVTESICWCQYVRVGLGRYSEALLSHYFRVDMNWELLLSTSIRMVLERFSTYEGILVMDDSGKKRSKVTKRIPFVHDDKDKEGSGSLRGQETVFLGLVTPLVTIPTGYAFYQPDPAYPAWAKEEKRLNKLGTPKALVSQFY